MSCFPLLPKPGHDCIHLLSVIAFLTHLFATYCPPDLNYIDVKSVKKIDVKSDVKTNSLLVTEYINVLPLLKIKT